MHPAIAIAIPASVGCAGALLVARGLIGRRVPTEPRCRRCDYELTDLLTHRCPECGTVLHPDRIRTARRIRWPKTVAWGILLAAVAGCTAWYRVPQRIERFIAREEWYAYAPTSFVIRRADRGDAKYRDELFRRVFDESMDATHYHESVRLALKRQKSPEQYSDAQAWVDLLEVLSVKKQLSDSKLREFYLTMVEPTLQVRPRVRSGEPIPFRVSAWCAAPTAHMYEWACTPVRLLIDGSEVHCASFTEQRGLAIAIGGTATCECTLNSASLTIGAHQLEVQWTFELRNGRTMGLGITEPPLVERAMRLSATFEILPADAPDTVTRLQGLKPYRELCSSFSASVKRLSSATDCPDVLCTPTIRLLKQLPCDVAFEVEMKNPGQTWTVGKLAIGRLERWPAVFQLESVVLPSADADRFMYVRLSASESVARGSVNAFSVWNGALEFPEDDTPQCLRYGYVREDVVIPNYNGRHSQ